jgi:hypothetical protein
MQLLPRLLGFSLLSLLAGLLLLTSCETTRTRESSDPVREAQRLSDEAADRRSALVSKQIAQLVEAGPPTFKTAQSVLASAFIRQFGDGTVIDKVLVRPAPSAPKEKTTYYLIGMGLKDGHFRAMALPLRDSGSGSLYLTPDAERYVLTGTGCPTCVFDFEGDRIVGSTCGDNVEAGSTCTFQVLESNTLFARR